MPHKNQKHCIVDKCMTIGLGGLKFMHEVHYTLQAVAYAWLKHSFTWSLKFEVSQCLAAPSLQPILLWGSPPLQHW